MFSFNEEILAGRNVAYCLMISARSCIVLCYGSDTCFIQKLGYDNIMVLR
jgi:hypothetical protein